MMSAWNVLTIPVSLFELSMLSKGFNVPVAFCAILIACIAASSALSPLSSLA
jgi:hypothetical protein